MRPCRKSSPALWPIWLLVAAWFCANVPPTTVFHACAWVKGAAHFSHSSELRQSVAALLAGQPREAKPQLASTATTPRSLPPALPAGPEVKKTDLMLLSGPLRLIASLPAVDRPELVLRAPVAPVAEVPCPPPRGQGSV